MTQPPHRPVGPSPRPRPRPSAPGVNQAAPQQSAPVRPQQGPPAQQAGQPPQQPAAHPQHPPAQQQPAQQQPAQQPAAPQQATAPQQSAAPQQAAAPMQQAAPQPPAEPISPQPQRDVDPRRPVFVQYPIPVATTDLLPGREIGDVVGVVVGVATRPRDMAHNPEMAYINTAARQDAVGALVQQAVEAGADAVVGLRFDGGKISETVTELTAYGTAVRLVPVSGR